MTSDGIGDGFAKQRTSLVCEVNAIRRQALIPSSRHDGFVEVVHRDTKVAGNLKGRLIVGQNVSFQAVNRGTTAVMPLLIDGSDGGPDRPDAGVLQYPSENLLQVGPVLLQGNVGALAVVEPPVYRRDCARPSGRAVWQTWLFISL